MSSKLSLIITDDADKRPSLAENVEIRMGIKPEVQGYIRLIPTHGIMTVEEYKWLFQSDNRPFFNYVSFAELVQLAEFDTFEER